MFIIDRFEDDWVILELEGKPLACPGLAAGGMEGCAQNHGACRCGATAI